MVNAGSVVHQRRRPTRGARGAIHTTRHQVHTVRVSTSTTMAPSGARARKAARALREAQEAGRTVERLGDGRAAPGIPLRDAVLPPMPAPLLGELLGKSKMGARLAANLAMGSTPKSKAGARVAAELALALGDGAAAVAAAAARPRGCVDDGRRQRRLLCVSCGTEDASAFSKRMLNKRGRHGDRAACRACRGGARAEQRVAEWRRAAPEGSRERSIRGGAPECAVAAAAAGRRLLGD